MGVTQSYLSYQSAFLEHWYTSYRFRLFHVLIDLQEEANHCVLSSHSSRDAISPSRHCWELICPRDWIHVFDLHDRVSDTGETIQASQILHAKRVWEKKVEIFAPVHVFLKCFHSDFFWPQVGGHLLPALHKVFRTRLITNSPWKWQVRYLPKRYLRTNIQRGSYSKAAKTEGQERQVAASRSVNLFTKVSCVFRDIPPSAGSESVPITSDAGTSKYTSKASGNEAPFNMFTWQRICCASVVTC
jgi:hypothetical protein